MNLNHIIRQHKILAILRNVPTDKVISYVGAAADGGIKLFEVALNSPDAFRQIDLIRNHFQDSVSLGAGTANSLAKAKEALQAGAEFLLSPSTDEEVLEYCAATSIPVLPGVLTPTDVSTCLRYGYRTMKLFPASAMPGNYVKSLKGPFDDTDYVAIGGVTAANIEDFLSQGYIGVGLGSNLIPEKFLEHGDWDRASDYIRKFTKEAFLHE